MLAALRTRTRRTAFIAVLALLLAQAIGLAHGIAHPQAQGVVVTALAPAAHADDAQGHDEGSPQCRLLDQLTHADLLAAPAPGALPAIGAAPPPAPATRPTPALALSRPRARGPPTLLA